MNNIQVFMRRQAINVYYKGMIWVAQDFTIHIAKIGII